MKASASRSLSPIRILMLEDNPADAALSVRKLKTADFSTEIDVTSNSAEFMAKAKSQTYDLVLGDYRVPGWTGLDALRWLRQSGFRMPFILLTGTLGDELAVECIKS